MASSCLVLLLVLVLAYGNIVPYPKYLVIIDAGGSSSKLRIYNWTLADHPYIPKVKSSFTKSFSPGISSFESNTPGLQVYIKSIINTARSQISQTVYKETPIYLMATAGLRTVDGKEKLLETTKSVLQDPTLNPFVYTPSAVEILSGEEEAVYAWIALNYLLGYFHNPDTPDTSFAGLMELGSRSTQIAFVPREPLLSGEFHVMVAGRLYQLYAHSYLQFGGDGIQVRIADRLCDECGDDPLPSPCTITGDKVQVTLESGAQRSIIGAYNLDACETLLESLVQPKRGMECEPKPCAIGNVYQPKVAGIQFYATQAFTYSPTFFKAFNEDKVTLNMALLKQASESYCNKHILEIPTAEKRFASANCLDADFMTILFTRAYGFPTDTKQIKVTSSINGQSADWSLGAALMEIMRSLTKEKTLFSVKRQLHEQKTLIL